MPVSGKQRPSPWRMIHILFWCALGLSVGGALTGTIVPPFLAGGLGTLAALVVAGTHIAEGGFWEAAALFLVGTLGSALAAFAGVVTLLACCFRGFW